MAKKQQISPLDILEEVLTFAVERNLKELGYLLVAEDYFRDGREDIGYYALFMREAEL